MIYNQLINNEFQIFFRFPLDLVDDVDHLRGLSWDQRNEDENNILDRGRSEESLTHQSQLLDTLQVTFFISQRCGPFIGTFHCAYWKIFKAYICVNSSKLTSCGHKTLFAIGFCSIRSSLLVDEG